MRHQDTTPEEWRPVVGYEGLYEVSSHGRVRSLERRIRRSEGYLTTIRGCVLKGAPGVHGYPVVTLSRKNLADVRYVHQLVAKTFLGPRPEGAVVCHADDVRTNNWVGNLRWGSRHDNAMDAVRNGLMPVGEAKANSKLTATTVREMRALYATGNYTHKELGVLFGVCRSIASRVITGKRWGHVQ